MYERFRTLCLLKGVTMSEACRVLGISPAVVSNWKARNGLPNGETTMKIAEYFGVSTDVVLGKEKSLTPYEIPLSSDELVLLELYRKDKDFNSLLRLSKYSDLLNESKEHN